MAAIIFDFDGTIADSFDYIAGYLAREAGQQRKSAADLQSLRGMSMTAMARQLGHRWWQLPGLFVRGRRAMRRAVSHVDPFPGMPDLIHKLHAEGHELFIVSSNSVYIVRSFLHRHKLHKYFLEIYGGVSILARRQLCVICSRNRIWKQKIVCISVMSCVM